MKRKRQSWLAHLVRCFNRGIEDFKAGKTPADCPYGDMNHRYAGGSVQMQRRRHWHEGFEYAKRETEE